MAVRAAEKDRSFRGNRIQQLFVRIGLREQTEVPSGADQPTRTGTVFVALADFRRDGFDRVEIRHIALREFDAAVHRMHVRVVKTRQHHLTLQIDVDLTLMPPRDSFVLPSATM